MGAPNVCGWLAARANNARVANNDIATRAMTATPSTAQRPGASRACRKATGVLISRTPAEPGALSETGAASDIVRARRAARVSGSEFVAAAWVAGGAN